MVIIDEHIIVDIIDRFGRGVARNQRRFDPMRGGQGRLGPDHRLSCGGGTRGTCGQDTRPNRQRRHAALRGLDRRRRTTAHTVADHIADASANTLLLGAALRGLFHGEIMLIGLGAAHKQAWHAAQYPTCPAHLCRRGLRLWGSGKRLDGARRGRLHHVLGGKPHLAAFLAQTGKFTGSTTRTMARIAQPTRDDRAKRHKSQQKVAQPQA